MFYDCLNDFYHLQSWTANELLNIFENEYICTLNNKKVVHWTLLSHDSMMIWWLASVVSFEVPLFMFTLSFFLVLFWVRFPLRPHQSEPERMPGHVQLPPGYFPLLPTIPWSRFYMRFCLVWGVGKAVQSFPTRGIWLFRSLQTKGNEEGMSANSADAIWLVIYLQSSQHQVMRMSRSFCL